MLKPNKILHIGDLHFKLLQDHDRIKQTIPLLKKTIIDENINLCYIGGDVVNDYNKNSPEQIELLINFFKEITDLVPIIMIIGNHDWNNNNDRLDSLSPIINSFTFKNEIHFLKYSGSYNLYGINWWVWSDLDNKRFEKIKFEGNNITIGCYHGIINGCKLNNNIILDKGFFLDEFKECDNVFLADIHLRQFFRNRDIAYCGSLFQIDWGETNDEIKGGLIWELGNKKYVAKDLNLETDFFLYTIKINDCYNFILDDKYLNKLKKKYIKLKIRLIYEGLKENYNKEIYSEISSTLKKYTQFNILKKKVFLKNEIKKNNKDIKDYFYEYFKDDLKSEEIELLKDLDFEYTNKLKINNFESQTIDLEKHELSYFGPFDKEQKIDFSNINGLIGISAENKTGKSYLLDSILFNLTNFTLRDVPKKKYLINKNNAIYSKLKTTLKTDLKKYVIEKNISFEDDNKVNFYEIDDINNIKSLNEKKQLDTLKKINNEIIDYDNLSMSNFYSQMYGKRFLNLKQSERFDYFTKILNLNIYEDKFQNSNNDLKNYKSSIEFKKIQIDDEIKKIELLNNEIDLLKSEIDIDLYKINKENKFNLLNKLEKLKEKFYVINLEFENFDYITQENKYNNNLLVINNLNNELLNKNNLFENIKNEIKVSEYNLNDIISLEVDKKLYKELNDLENELYNLKNTRCKTCKRVFDNINEIENEKKNIIIDREILSLKENIEKENIKIKNIKLLYKQYIDLENELEKRKSLLIKYNSDNEIIKNNINRYNKEKKSFEKKNKLKEEINILNNEINAVNNIIKEYENIEKNIENKNILLEDKTKRIIDLKNEIFDIEKKCTYLDFYVKGMNKRGIRSLIIEDKINYINNFLEEMLLDFNFNIEIKVSDKNEIEVFFYDESDLEQYASLCSGMESFLIDLSLKNAFSQISELNKLNLFIIDEGFGTLDSMNLELITNFLNRLKKYNDKILVVTHIESLKSIFDYNFILEKNGLNTIIK